MKTEFRELIQFNSIFKYLSTEKTSKIVGIQPYHKYSNHYLHLLFLEHCKPFPSQPLSVKGYLFLPLFVYYNSNNKWPLKITDDLPESRSIKRKAHNTNGCEWNLCQSSYFASINLSKSVCEGNQIKIGKILEFLSGRIGQIRRPVFVNNDIEIDDNLTSMFKVYARATVYVP